MKIKRLIDPNELLKFAESTYHNTIIPSDIKAFPTVEAVEVVHARWVDVREICGDYMCSNCDALYGTNKFNYCPNCGADMRGEEDG